MRISWLFARCTTEVLKRSTSGFLIPIITYQIYRKDNLRHVLLSTLSNRGYQAGQGRRQVLESLDDHLLRVGLLRALPTLGNRVVLELPFHLYPHVGLEYHLILANHLLLEVL